MNSVRFALPFALVCLLAVAVAGCDGVVSSDDGGFGGGDSGGAAGGGAGGSTGGAGGSIGGGSGGSTGGAGGSIGGGSGGSTGGAGGSVGGGSGGSAGGTGGSTTTFTDGGTYGVPVAGYPSWRERTIFTLTNAVRMSPADYKASAAYAAATPSLNVAFVLGAPYPAQPPLLYDSALNHSSRQHSQEMADFNYFAHTSVDGGSPFVRIASYYTASGTLGENIAAGTAGDPIAIMYGWLCDKATAASTTCCTDATTCDGHRLNIMNGGYHALGTGYGFNSGSTYKHYWTQDFGGVASGPSPLLVDGTHLLIGTTKTRFVANVAAPAAVQSVSVVLDGVSTPMALELGTSSRGTWFVVQNRGVGCRSYHFEALDSAGLGWRFPGQGQLRTTGEGTCVEEFVP